MGFRTRRVWQRNPRPVSEMELAINRADPEYCAAQQESGVRSTIHYHELDDPDSTTFAMLSMGNAGLRVWDVRNPRRPTEVAYFNPGQYRLANGTPILDRSGNHTRYVTRRSSCGTRTDTSSTDRGRGRCETGYIWLTTRTGGFWVLELEPQVRTALGTSSQRIGSHYPEGRPARPPEIAANAAR